MILIITSIIIFVLYGSLMLFYFFEWKKVIPFENKNGLPSTQLSVIIAARNEEESIGPLLSALTNQSYPSKLFEVIVVDDHSTDNTTDVVKQFETVKLVILNEPGQNSYKKKAIETGILHASGDLIVTTDADCLPGKNWLLTLASFYQKKDAVFIAAPVVFRHQNNVLQIFQALDFLTLQGITAVSVNSKLFGMSNGANMAYNREIFSDVGGFSGIDKIASGDDMLLMNKIWEKDKKNIHYLLSPDAIVSTSAMPTWKSFFNQRIRWASKAAYYKNFSITVVMVLVYLFNLLFPILFFAGFWISEYWFWLIGLWIGKTIIEWPFVYSVAKFYGKQRLMKYFLFFQPLHVLYTIIAGFLGQFGAYEWKGRKVK